MRAILNLVERILLGGAAIALVLMMFSISLDAMGRHFFNHPFQGNFEITSLYLMVIVVFATLSANYRQGVHVRLDVLSEKLVERLGKNYPRLIALICLPVFALFTWYAVEESIHKFARLETRMGSIPFPIYLSYVWVALGAGTLSLRFCLDIISPEEPRSSNDALMQEDVS